MNGEGDIQRQLQLKIVDILVEIDRICKKHDIKYYLAYGTAIGAVRHNGFIPWDDDADIHMFKEDYEKFAEVCKSELGDKFFLQNEQTDKGYKMYLPKVRMNNTAFVESFTKDWDIHHGIYVDIFILDECPKSDLLKKLNVETSARELVGNLSIAQQQMVEIAKALSLDAQIIIMDEPTDALTDKETESLFNVINELKNEGKALVYISHRLKEIFEICDYITVLRDGKFVGTEYLCNLDEDKMIEMMVGRKLTDQFPRLETEKGDTVLKVENLCNEYVDNVSFEVKAGEILGISGLMGAGRTELAKTIYGHFKKTSGKVYIKNREIDNKSAKDGLKNRIAYVSEDRKGDGLILDLSVRENMAISSLNRMSSFFRIDKKKELARVQDYIGRMRIKTPSEEQLKRNLRGGNQQKIAIAKALMTHPDVLILDEPTRGVDVGAKKEIYDLINEFKSHGKAVIMISSEMPEILGLSDRILVLCQGRITGEFEIESATQEAILKCAVEAKEA